MDTLTYLTLTQSFFTLMPNLGNMGLSEHVLSGQIVIELNRPINFYKMYMAKRFGIFCFFFQYRFLPVLILGSFFGVLNPPAEYQMLPLFLLSILLGFWIAVSIMFLVESSSFWFQSDKGFKVCMYGIFSFFSGLLIPLNYFPDWALSFTKLLPFAYTFDAPVQIYLGIQGDDQILTSFIGQFFWLIVLSLTCLFVLKQGANKLEIHGG